MSTSDSASRFALVGDITPWWWGNGREDHAAKLKGLVADWVAERAGARVEFSDKSVRLRVSLGSDEDTNRTQEQIAALRDLLDEMVTAGAA
jgi:hypothetical protein